MWVIAFDPPTIRLTADHSLDGQPTASWKFEHDKDIGRRGATHSDK